MLLFFKTQATQLQHLTDTSYISQSNTKELLKNYWKKDFYLILKNARRRVTSELWRKRSLNTFG